MATAVEAMLRTTPAANTTALMRWAQAMSDYRDNGVGTNAQMVGLFRATGIPIGSAFGQYAMALIRSVTLEIFADGDWVNDLSRQVEQKLPIGDAAWVQDINPVILGIA